ncbi:MAG: peptidoglycan endopeptidase [Ignavibacteria bacterium]|nr:peptidoglycan endopeptidase [Ignavibacteria bacterium]
MTIYKRSSIGLIIACCILLISCNEQKVKPKQEVVESGPQKLYAVSKYPTPVLNTPYIDSVYGGNDGNTLKKSKTGLVKELEYVAYVGSSFEILNIVNKGSHSIYEVNAADYSIPELKIDLFIDSRFVDTTSSEPKKRTAKLPQKDEIIRFMYDNIGALYVWGGNNIEGVQQMLSFYPPKGKLDQKEEKEWGLKGVDCSGLLYQATDGYTPRNTHQLVHYGSPVEIEGLSAEQIVSLVEPLDLIVWKGHLIVITDSNTTIQSAHSSWGVVKKDLDDVLRQLLLKRKAVNEWVDDSTKQFVIRRWYKGD